MTTLKQKQTTKKSAASVVESLIRSYKLRVEPRGFSYTNDLDLMVSHFVLSQCKWDMEAARKWIRDKEVEHLKNMAV